MKFTVIFIFLSMLQVHASTYAQQKKLSLQMQNATIESVFEAIENQSEFAILYKDDQVDLKRKVNVSVEDQTVDDLLLELFEGTDNHFVITDRHIVITKRENDATTGAQQKVITVKGKVTDTNGGPIPGASILVKGTTTGVITDFDGNYSISVPADAILIFSFVGMQTQEVAYKGQSTINIKLVEDVQELEELVVVGYGTQKKSNLTGAVEIIKAEGLENRPVSSTTAMLEGQTTGLVIGTPSGGFTPGANQTLQIRGSGLLGKTTQPLIIIDGIPADMGDFNNLNPNDIENISVLKDAAASAVYGATGAFGVIVVTTKAGKTNTKAVIEYSANFGIVQPVNMPDPVNSYHSILAQKDAFKNSGKANHPQIREYDDEALDIMKDNWLNPGKYAPEELSGTLPWNESLWDWGAKSFGNTNFYDVWFQPSFRQQHTVSARGGSDKNTYSFSAAYIDQPGILEFIEDIDNFKRYNINGAFSSQMKDWLKLTYRTRYLHTKSMAPTLDYQQGRGRIYAFTYGAWPNMPYKNPDGTYNWSTRIPQAIGAGQAETNVHRFDNTLALDLTPVKGLTIHADGNYRIAVNDKETLNKPVYMSDPSTGGTVLIGGTESSLLKRMTLTNYWTTQAYVAYQRNFGKHFAKVQFGGQASETNVKWMEGSNTNLLVTDIPSFKVSTNDTPTLTDALSENATAGFFGRINYNYAEKYLFELNGRHDGSAQFTEDKRWATFLSVSGGWVMSHESFWDPIRQYVSRAKIRGSYGSLGNQGQLSGAAYPFIPSMNMVGQSPWIFNGSRLPYVQTPGIINPYRTWETINTTDISLELGFFKNRLTSSFGYYIRESLDQFGPAEPYPSVLGVAPPQVNNADMETKGFEAMLSWRDKVGRFNYGVNFNISDSQTEITKYNTDEQVLSSYYAGKQLGDIWGFESNRLLNESDFDESNQLIIPQSSIHGKWRVGDVRYEDINDDGEIRAGLTEDEPGDLKVIGNSRARYIYGINLNMGYTFEKAGRVSVSATFNGVGKRDVVPSNNGYYYWGVGTGTRATPFSDHMDFYRDENSFPRLVEELGVNTDAKFPRPYWSTEGTKNFRASTRFLQNGAYLRLKNVRVNYDLPKTWLSVVGLAKCGVFFSGENLFTITELPDYIDPQLTVGRAYPQQTTYSFGLNVSF